MKSIFFGFLSLLLIANSHAGTHFQKVFVIILENTEAPDALKQPYLKSLVQQGTYLDQFYAIQHPSQPNYVALTSGDTDGVGDDDPVDLNVTNIADLMEAKGLTWKAYAEDYPGNCFTDSSSDNYERKHNPFISYLDIQKNPKRCANIVNSSQLQSDITNGNLANYTLYVPNMQDDGHDTDVKFSSTWLQQTFGPLFANSAFMKDTLVVITFDEGKQFFGSNHIYTMLLGDSVKPNFSYETKVNTYSLLKMIEDNFGVGNLGRNDVTAVPIDGIWKN